MRCVFSWKRSNLVRRGVFSYAIFIIRSDTEDADLSLSIFTTEIVDRLKHRNGDVTLAISDRTDIDEVENITDGEDIPFSYEYDVTSYQPVDKDCHEPNTWDVRPHAPCHERHPHGVDESRMCGESVLRMVVRKSGTV